jgi:hypothetical protein
MAVLLIGLTPMSPTMEVVPVVEIPDFDRMANSPAVPRLTGARVAPVVLEVVVVERVAVGVLVLDVEEVIEAIEVEVVVVEVGSEVVEIEVVVVVEPVADVVADVVIDVVTVVVVTLVVVVTGIVDVLEALDASVVVEEAVVARAVDSVVVVTVVF